MGLFSFVKNAGAKIFGAGKEEVKEPKQRANRVLEHLRRFNLRTDGVTASLMDEDKLVLTGQVDTLQEKTRILATAGNIAGIAEVEDNINIAEEAKAELEKQFYTVKSGDYLSKIAKAVYGDANKYNVIFEANKPMLEHPDKIYPGQVLVIPPLEA